MAEHRARRALAPILAVALVAAVLALVPMSRAEAETQLKWLVTRDDVGLVDGNDASGEGEPVKVDGAGHPLLIGQAYDPDEPDFFMRFGGGKIVALDPADGTVAWEREDIHFDDVGLDPYDVLSTGDVIVAERDFDEDTSTSTYRLVVLDDADGTSSGDFAALGELIPVELLALPGGAVAVLLRNPDFEDATPTTVTVLEADGSERWSESVAGSGSDIEWDPANPTALLFSTSNGSDAPPSIFARKLESGFTESGQSGQPTLGSGFSARLLTLPTGLLVVGTGKSVELYAVDQMEYHFIRQDALSTESTDAAKKLPQEVFGLTEGAPDGTLLVGAYRDYYGGEIGTGPQELRHQLITIGTGSAGQGTLTLGELLPAAAAPSPADDDHDRPASAIGFASPLGVPDVPLIIGAVPNYEESGQAALYGQRPDGTVAWTLDATSGIGTSHNLGPVCADGTLYGRSSASDPDNETGGREVWYAVAEAAPAVDGTGCERPRADVEPSPSPSPSATVTASPTASPSASPTASPTASPGGSQDGRIAADVAAEPVPLGAAVCQQLVPDDGGADAVVLARDDAFADALAGAPLAGDDRCILFTEGGPNATLNPATRTEIQRALGDGGRVYVLGGQNAVSTLVSDELDGLGYEVLRLQGASRYETAIAVADRVVLERGTGPTEVLLAFSFNYADAVTGGAYGAEVAAPVLLTDTGELHPATEQWLDQHPSVTATRVLGGTVVIGDAVAAAVPGPTRHRGDSRMGTATRIAEELWRPAIGALDAFTVVNLGNFGTGGQFEAWTVALAAAPYSAQQDAPQLGVFLDEYPTETRDYLEGLGGTTPAFTLVGGVDVIRPEVAEALPG